MLYKGDFHFLSKTAGPYMGSAFDLPTSVEPCLVSDVLNVLAAFSRLDLYHKYLQGGFCEASLRENPPKHMFSKDAQAAHRALRTAFAEPDLQVSFARGRLSFS